MGCDFIFTESFFQCFMWISVECKVSDSWTANLMALKLTLNKEKVQCAGLQSTCVLYGNTVMNWN